MRVRVRVRGGGPLSTPPLTYYTHPGWASPPTQKPAGKYRILASERRFGQISPAWRRWGRRRKEYLGTPALYRLFCRSYFSDAKLLKTSFSTIDFQKSAESTFLFRLVWSPQPPPTLGRAVDTPRSPPDALKASYYRPKRAPKNRPPQRPFRCSRFAKPVRSVPVPSSVGLRRRPASADPNSQSPNPHRPASSDLSVSNPIPATTPHHHPGPLSNPAPAHGRRRVDPRRSRRSPSHEATRVVPETSRLCAPTALSFHPNASPLT